MSVFRCLGCRGYFRRGTEYASVGLGWVCSEQCLHGATRRKQRRGPLSLQPPAQKQGKTRSSIPSAVRNGVLYRDHYQCRWCGKSSKTTTLHLHHVNYLSQGIDHSEHNLITLCSPCHERAHSDKRRWQPILRGVVWQTYAGRWMQIPQFERWIHALELAQAR